MTHRNVSTTHCLGNSNLRRALTWDGWWRYRGNDRVLSLGDHADPVLMGVTVQIIPVGASSVGVAHHLHTALAAVMVVGLSITPVGVTQSCAITPAITWDQWWKALKYCTFLI